MQISENIFLGEELRLVARSACEYESVQKLLVEARRRINLVLCLNTAIIINRCAHYLSSSI